LIADYGSFQVIQLDEVLAGAMAGQPGIEDASEDNVIALNAARLDTTASEVKALRKPAVAGNGKRLHLVHFADRSSLNGARLWSRTGLRL